MGFNGWLVVWNIWMIFPVSWECHHPNWSELHHFSDGWLNHQPAVSLTSNVGCLNPNSHIIGWPHQHHVIGASWLPCSTLTWQRTIIDISHLHIFIDYRSYPIFRFPHVNYRVLPINKCLITSNPIHDHCSLILPIVHTNSLLIQFLYNPNFPNFPCAHIPNIQKWGISGYHSQSQKAALPPWTPWLVAISKQRARTQRTWTCWAALDRPWKLSMGR